MSESKAKYAGFWIRVIADFLDSTLLDVVSCLLELMILGAVYGVGVLIFSREKMGGSFLDAFDPFFLQLSLVGIRGALSLFYFSWGTYRYGTTLGKRCFHIYVVSEAGHSPVNLKQSIIRCAAYLVSYLPFGTGFLMVAFQPEKRGLHDLIAGTVSVIKKKSPGTGILKEDQFTSETSFPEKSSMPERDDLAFHSELR